MGEQKQFLRLSYRPMGHLARDLDHPLVLGPLDHRANVQLWPNLQTGSPDSAVLLDLLAEGPTNTVGIGTPAVCQNQQREHRLSRSANLEHQAVGQTAITRELDHPTQPQ